MRSRELQSKFKKYISKPASKGELPCKLRRYMSKPVRALNKARDLYVKSLEECAGKVGGGHGGVLGCPAAAPQVSRLPKSFSFNYSKPNIEEKFMNFLETISKKRSLMEYDSPEEEEEDDEPRHVKDQYNGLKRSYSTIVGLARIDEDEPSYFEEEDPVYVSCRSYAYLRY